MANSRRQMFAAKKLRERYETQLREEANGAPIPGDIAELMTKPKPREELYQVKVDIRQESGKFQTIPASPKIGMEACEQFLIALNGAISLGKLRGWSNARLEPVTAL